MPETARRVVLAGARAGSGIRFVNVAGPGSETARGLHDRLRGAPAFGAGGQDRQRSVIRRQRQRLLRTSAGGERPSRWVWLSLAVHGLAAVLLLLTGLVPGLQPPEPAMIEPAMIEVVFGRSANAPGAAVSAIGQSAPANAAPVTADRPPLAESRDAAGDMNREVNGDAAAEAIGAATGMATAAAASPPGGAPPTPRGEGDPKLEFADADPTLLPAQADTGNRAPPYPEEAYRRDEEGTVVLRLHIADDGRVERVEITQSSGSPWLDEAAQKTLGTWHFRPARREGRPVRSYRDQPVRFVLQ